MKTSILFLALNFLMYCCTGQTGTSPDSINISYGEVSRHDFMITMPGADSNADAIVLSDLGRTVLEGYSGGFRTVFTRSRRIRIINRRALEEATVHLHFSIDDNDGKKLKNFKASTFNIENGRIIATPVTDKEIFLDHSGGDMVDEKFTFPNAKEGSVIEYTYTLVSSDYFSLHPWYFQGPYPTLFSTYAVDIPDIFNYVFLVHGKRPPTTNLMDSTPVILYSHNIAFTTHIHTTIWNASNIPSIKEEPFTSTLDNFVSGVKFQLSVHPVRPGVHRTILGSWQSACEQLLASERFGIAMQTNDKKLKQFTDKLVAGTNTDLEKARKIFSYIRDNFKSDGYGIIMSPGITLNDILQKKTGTTADLNLLLIAMLRSQNIQADPVILSTRDNGLVNIAYPIMDNFNYVVCRVYADNASCYLDASSPKIGFGKIPDYCYNGPAKVITANNYVVLLYADSLTEAKKTSVSIVNENSDSLSAVFLVNPGYFESLKIRTAESSSTLSKGYQDDEQKKIPFDYRSSGPLLIDSLRQYDQPVALHYKLKFKLGDNDLVYFNPMLNAAILKNPFISSERSYPIEMPYRMDESYLVDMEIPKGYIVEELPGSNLIKLNKENGLFSYEISSTNGHIICKSRLVLNKAIFDPEDYHALRDFYTQVIKKQSEMIVFRKK